MMRISKLTDYGVIIMAFMAGDPLRLFQAKELAKQTTIAEPTVSKLLKKLTKNKLLHSARGSQGGYILALEPKEITIAMLVNALEGPIAITECNLGHDYCSSATECSVKTPWMQINDAITNTLKSIKLNDLIKSVPANHAVHLPHQRIEVHHV